MSEPEVHDVSTHPCARCAGPCKVEFRDWMDPAHHYVVFCKGCGNIVTGASLEEAVSAWDEANPAREVDPDDAHAVQCMLVQTQLTPHMLDVLDQAQAAFLHSGEEQDLDTFITWCKQLATSKGAV